MYSTKKNVQYLVALLEAYGIEDIVLSPGSRNAPLIHTFASCPSFKCTFVVDERSAAFVALGMIQKIQKPVAICCTSGTALLNYAPAVAEAYYQQLPMIIISADRPAAWIGQMDGQTIVQNHGIENIVKKSVQLPEIHTAEDEWFCQRLVHECLLECNYEGKGPVHINIPISEPLFDFSAVELPEVRQIQKLLPTAIDLKDYIVKWKQASKRMIIVGQLPPNSHLNSLLFKLSSEYDCVILAEQLSNIRGEHIIESFDTVLHKIKDDALVPDLLISFGGHIVSKRLKHFCRRNKIKQHWRVSDDRNFVDLFQSLTDDIKTDPINFIEALLTINDLKEDRRDYQKLWTEQAQEISQPGAEKELPFSDLMTIKTFLQYIPTNSVLYVANSSTVRNTQLFELDSTIQVFCNRGTNGIDGAISTAIGFCKLHIGLVFLIVGDLSFFYDIGALCQNEVPQNLRILLLNNGGGAIFSQLPVPDKTEYFDKYVAGEHNNFAGKYISEEDIEYLSVSNSRELNMCLSRFVNISIQKPVLLEILTDNKINTEVLKDYYKNFK